MFSLVRWPLLPPSPLQHRHHRLCRNDPPRQLAAPVRAVGQLGEMEAGIQTVPMGWHAAGLQPAANWKAVTWQRSRRLKVVGSPHLPGSQNQILKSIWVAASAAVLRLLASLFVPAPARCTAVDPCPGFAALSLPWSCVSENERWIARGGANPRAFAYGSRHFTPAQELESTFRAQTPSVEVPCKLKLGQKIVPGAEGPADSSRESSGMAFGQRKARTLSLSTFKRRRETA